ncbi:unnamed protein product, partial [Effrenium voratum]
MLRGHVTRSWTDIDIQHVFKNQGVTSLKKLRYSPPLIFLRVWHTYGIWVGACVYFTISANLMLAWYIDWYRTSITCEGDVQCSSSQLLSFPLGPFFAIFLRTWLLVCIVGDLLRFCYLLAKDAWEEDTFRTYRRVVCCDFWRDIEAEVSAKVADGEWSEELLDSTGRRCLDAALQISIYLALDVFPLVSFLVSYLDTENVGQAFVYLSASLSGGSCIHVLLFYFAMWVTDIVTKWQAFRQACRGVARVPPCEYPGESLQNFQWAGEFGDRHLANLESARCISFVEDIPEGPNVSPDSSGAFPAARNLSSGSSLDLALR